MSQDATLTQLRAPSSTASTASRLAQLLGWYLLSLPVITLAIICVRTSVNIPFQDDYGIYGITEFLELWVKAPTVIEKLKWLAASQHVQYKLFYMHIVELIQYWCTGATNYRVLQLIGDAALLGVPVVLWFLLARSGRPLSQRIWLFVFPCYLFLTPCYVQTINWALSGLQNISVVPFALASIFFVTASWRGSFAWSIAFLILSIATSGNGFFLVFVFLYFLLRSRQVTRAIITVAVAAAMAALYAYRYHAYMVIPPVALRLSIERKLIFPFVFLGAPAASRNAAFLLGLLLVVGFIVLTRKGWERVCPGSFGAALFCLITSAAVSFTRANGGLPEALSGRYMMYSLELICLEYLAVLRLYAPLRFSRHRSWTAALAALSLTAIILCAFAELTAYRELQARRNILITHLILWERHPNRLVLIPDEGPEKQTGYWPWLRYRFQDDLTRETRMGLYHPPVTAHDPLPVRTHSQATVDIENEHP